MRNTESGEGLATDDAVSSLELYVRGYNAYSCFSPYTRTMIKASYRHRTATSVQVDAGTPLTCSLAFDIRHTSFVVY
jgi:hypothetical protein